MKPLDNYLIALAMTMQKLDIAVREDGWPAIPIKGSAVAFHLGRFIFHAARIVP
jgi:hypothetical protein